jgi:S-adenosylmethionine:tRNA ribosyltransferase-isomerase
MYISEFDYDLPEALIAHYPLAKRSASRLLYLNKQTGECSHRYFADILEFISPNDLLVFNDSKVIPARLFALKQTGGRVEILVERILDSHRVLAQVRASKSPKPNSKLIVENAVTATVLNRQDDLFELAFESELSSLEILYQYGHVPIPSYVKRADESLDKERYQTVYAKTEGSAAAPTAGLHFDEALLDALAARGIAMEFVTLHVGAGTFQPVRCDDITQHKMHSEYMEVSVRVCEQIHKTKARGGRVIAVGTTTVRALETMAQAGEFKPYQGNTQIFIYPGYSFRCIDAMITNFHYPRSSLLMLICAFAGRENTMNAYQEAIRERYRFYSYGDAMLIMSTKN